jgi:hypothetical protein
MGASISDEQARDMFSRFNDLKDTMDTPTKAAFPDLACFTVQELKDYIASAETFFEENNIPEAERGIALMFGRHPNSGKSHLQNMATVMLVGSSFTANDETGQVTNIDNAVLNSSSVLQNVSYDQGALSP